MVLKYALKLTLKWFMRELSTFSIESIPRDPARVRHLGSLRLIINLNTSSEVEFPDLVIKEDQDAESDCGEHKVRDRDCTGAYREFNRGNVQ